MKNLNDKVIWALSDAARDAVSQLVDLGFDADLALALIENHWPEASVYNLPEKDMDAEALCNLNG